MAGYSNLLSSFGTQANPIVPQFGSELMDMGQPINLGDFGQVGGTAGGIGDILGNAGKFTTKDMITTGLGGIQTLGGLIGAFGSYNLAKKQYGLTKRMAETNLSNQVGAYNLQLEDKARSRAVVEGQSDSDRDAYIARNRATTG